MYFLHVNHPQSMEGLHHAILRFFFPGVTDLFRVGLPITPPSSEKVGLPEK